MRKLFSYREKGFSIFEVIIALTIFSIGVLSSMASLTLALRSAATSQFNLVAVNLVQEGLEIVRNKRDTNWVQQDLWNKNLNPGVYRVVWNSTNLEPLNPGQLLRYDAVNNGFNYSDGVITIYSRTVSITIINPNEIQVVVEVIWDDRGKSKTVSAETHLFNWK